MLEQYKPGITLFSILAIIAILFPPVVWETKLSVRDKGFAFLFAIPKYKTTLEGTINFSQLFLELFLILIISILFQIYYKKIQTWFKQH